MYRSDNGNIDMASLASYDRNNLKSSLEPNDKCHAVEKVSVDKDNARVLAGNEESSLGRDLKTSGLHKSINGRDGNQVWTPLLANGNCKKNNNKSNGNEHSNGSGDNNVIVYDQNASNNNDWVVATVVEEKVKNEKIQKHSNNNGSLLSGKNGIGLPDKYDEQDPLTGLCKQHHAKLSTDNETDDLEINSTKSSDCGLFGFTPKWAKPLATTNVFMIVFLLAYVLQGMFQTYFVSVITTIEKLFQIKSKTTGILLSAAEMGQICTALLLTYFAGQGHRPRWIACGMVIWSFAVFTCALPHFLFGEQLKHSTAVLTFSPFKDSEDGMFHNASTDELVMHSFEANLCIMEDHTNNKDNVNFDCDETRKMEQENHSEITMIVLCIFFGSIFSSGIGQTAVGTLGIPYIDDNVSSKQTPMYMAVTLGVRILGPACGFIVGSFCTRYYVDFSDPGFDASDTRWLGAWWLGPVIIGSVMLLSSIAMFSFPKELRKHTKTCDETGETIPNKKKESSVNACETTVAVEKPKLRDFPRSVRRQLSNDILMFRTASVVFHLLPISGLYIFLPKYLETQFRLAPYDANMFAASCGILVMGVGIVTSGWAMMKLKPSAKAVAGWIAATALMYSAGMVVLMFVGCNMNDFAGYQPATVTGSSVIQPACEAAKDCVCDQNQFSPICGVDGKIYISSCHAGCETVNKHQTDKHIIYSKCACIENGNQSWSNGNASAISDMNGMPAYEAVSGFCDSSCQSFVVFIFIFVVCVFMHSSSEVGSTVLMMRCTDPKDKAMAMGIMQSAIGLFGNIPCPIIYGAVVDSACLLWKSVCGTNGACSLYDANTFRHFYLGMTSAIMFLGFLMDLVVWSKAGRINITPEDSNVDKNNADENKTCTPDTNV